jgi:hypothetical protein
MRYIQIPGFRSIEVKMNKPTKKEKLNALKGSVREWTREVDTGMRGDCPLCLLISPSIQGSCDGCPIKEKTGHDQCLATPFVTYDGTPKTARIFRDWLQELYVEYLEKYSRDLEEHTAELEEKNKRGKLPFKKEWVDKCAKKEVWVDVSAECKLEIKASCDGNGYFLTVTHRDNLIGYVFNLPTWDIDDRDYRVRFHSSDNKCWFEIQKREYK